MSVNSDRAREILALLEIGQREAAALLEISEREFRRMCADSRPFPKAVMLALEELARRKGEGK